MKKIFIKPGILIPVGAAVIAAFLFLWTGETIRPDFPSVYPESAFEKISDAEVERKVNALLAAMTEEEVYAMLGGSHSAASAKGYGTGYVGGVPRLGVPVLRMWDGPKGVVGNGGLTTTSPASGPALAASFDEKLAYEYGRMLGEENRVCQVKCVSLYFFLTGSFQSCRFCMPGSILFILQNACLHFVIHGKLVADECPVGYRAATPFLIQFHNPQIECLAYSILIGKCPFFCDLTKT